MLLRCMEMHQERHYVFSHVTPRMLMLHTAGRSGTVIFLFGLLGKCRLNGHTRTQSLCEELEGNSMSQ